MGRNVTARILRDPPPWRAGVNVDCEWARREAARDAQYELRERMGDGTITLERARALLPRRWPIRTDGENRVTEPTKEEHLIARGWRFDHLPARPAAEQWRASHDSGMGAVYAPTKQAVVDLVWNLTGQPHDN